MLSDVRFQGKSYIGNLKAGRTTLGNAVSVSVYRMTVYSLRAVMREKLSVQTANEIFFEAGKMAGEVIFDNFLSSSIDEKGLFENVSTFFQKSKIGCFEVLSSRHKKREFIFTLKEDLDCSGLPSDGETKCTFDEGMISGILGKFYGEPFLTTEISCWGTGEKKCSFRSRPVAADKTLNTPVENKKS